MSYIEIWKNQIILKLDPLPDDPITGHQEHNPTDWDHIGERAKWSKRVGGFCLALSKQNLQRIHRQFGPLRVASGRGRIEQLKKELAEFNAIVAKAVLAKTSPVLPHYDYKVKPIGPYQHRGVVYLVNVPLGVLWADCGTGKTFMAACAVEQLVKKGLLARGKTLVCAKIATLHQGWLDDIQKFTDLTVAVLWIPTNYKRKEKILKLLAEPADIYIINHEGVRIYEEALAEKRFDAVIVDESTVMKSFHSAHEKAKGGKFVKALIHVAAAARRKVVMSGTPAPNGPQDMWGQLHPLDPNGFMMEASFRDFREEHMLTHYFGDPNKPDTPKSYSIKPESIGIIGDIVNRLAYRVRIRDVLPDLPERTIIKRMVAMGPEQARHYAEMEATLHTEVDEAHVSVTITLAQIQKLRQITGGFILDHQGNAHLVDNPTPKLEMLDQLLREEIGPDKKVVIFAQHKWEFEQLAERYKDIGLVTYYGDDTAKDKLNSLEQFMKGDAPAIAAHPKSCAHGLTWTMAHYMIFYSVSHSSEEDYQCIKRIERNSQKHKMFVYYLLCTDTVDEAMYDVVQLKHHQQSALIDPDQQQSDAAAIWDRLRGQVQRHKRKKKG